MSINPFIIVTRARARTRAGTEDRAPRSSRRCPPSEGPARDRSPKRHSPSCRQRRGPRPPLRLQGFRPFRRALDDDDLGNPRRTGFPPGRRVVRRRGRVSRRLLHRRHLHTGGADKWRRLLGRGVLRILRRSCRGEGAVRDRGAADPRHPAQLRSRRGDADGPLRGQVPRPGSRRARARRTRSRFSAGALRAGLPASEGRWGSDRSPMQARWQASSP